MRLLILGESDSTGLVLEDPSVAWGNRASTELEGRSGDTLETTHVRFFSWVATAESYLEKLLADGPFDTVVLSTTKVGFTTFTVDNRIREILGNRAGSLFQNAVAGVDRRTLWRQPPGWKRTVNQAGHRVARRVIGLGPVATSEAVTNGYLQTMKALARLEDTLVVVVLAPQVPSSTLLRHPKLGEVVEQFRTAMRGEALRRRFSVVDPMEVMPPPGAERDRLFIDDVHKTPELHEMLAAAVVKAVIAGSSK